MSGIDRPTILHVVNTLDGGGTERTLIRLLHELDRSVCRHAVVTLRRAGALVRSLPDDVPCRALETLSRSKCRGLTLASAAREFRAAVVHARNTCCWADATLAGLRTPRAALVLGFHGRSDPGPFSRRDRAVAKLAAWIGGRFLTPSASGAAKITSELRVPADRVRTIPNGIDAYADQPRGTNTRTATRARWGIGAGDLVIGSVGSLTPVKRHDLLIQAFAQLREGHRCARLLLVGDGPLRESLSAQCRALKIDDAVIRAGRQDEVGPMLEAMDIYACTSDSEGMSNALLEAIATGLPVVATDVGDNGLIVRHLVEGIIIPPTDAAALAFALVALADDPSRRSHYGSAARKRAASFQFHDTVRAYDAYYRALLSPTRRLSHDGLAEFALTPAEGR